MNKFNNWILDKISSFLVSKEGCVVVGTRNNPEYSVLKLKDSFGFLYEIEVRLVGHTHGFNTSDFKINASFIEKME